MKLLLIVAALLSPILACTQSASKSESKPEEAMDFWVGEWSCKGKSRNAPGKDEWTATTAKNSIKREFKGRVIQENFSMAGFEGKSWTVWNPNRKIFQQTWVDDSGSYIALEGGLDGDKVVLNQLLGPMAPFKMRMVFQNFTSNGFQWLWQRSTDEGKTWETQWELNYKKA